MAKKTRTLSNEELAGFMGGLQRQRQFNNYQQTVRANRPTGGGDGFPEPRPQQGGGGGWDNAIHVGGRILNILGALGYGTNAALDAGFDKAEAAGTKLRAGDMLGAIQDAAPAVLTPLGVLNEDWRRGVGDAITGNDANLKHGFEIIEKGTDVLGRNTNPNYVDKQDNVDPIAKGVAGFAVDALGDPLTYLPAGPLASGVSKGLSASAKAARAAEGGNLAKTGAFFNPVTAAKGFGQGVAEWGTDAANVVKGLAPNAGTAGARPVVDEALQNLATTGSKKAANLASATGKKAPAQKASATTASQRVAQGVAEGARAAEAQQAAARGGIEDIIADTRKHTFKEGDSVTLPGNPLRWVIERAPDGTLQARAPKSKQGVIPESKFPAQGFILDRPIVKEAEEAAELAAEKDVRSRIAEQLAPDLARAADAGSNTSEVLGNLRALTYQTNRHPARVQREIEKLAPLADRRQVKDWTANVAALVGEDAAKKLRKIADPEEFAAQAKNLARERVTNTMEGKTPTDLFRKLASGRNEFDPASVREIAKLLGLKDVPEAKDWKSFSDHLHRMNPKAAYDEMKRQELIQRDVLSETGLPGAGVAEQLAKDIDPEGVKVAAASDADNLLSPELRAEYDEAIAGVFPKDFGKTHPFTKNSKKTGEAWHLATENFSDDAKPVAKYVFNQNHQLTLWKNLFEKAQQRGFKGATRQDDLYEYITDGLAYADLRLRSLGISPVNGALGAEKSLLKTKGDHAFLSFGDILHALPDETGKALLFGGKDINVTPTLLADTAREALRLAETDLDSVAQATALLHKLQQRLTKEFGTDAKKTIQKRLADPKNHALLRGLAGAFTNPETIQKIAAANARNLAFATAVNGKAAWRALAPIVETLRRFAEDPNVSVGTQIDAVLDARKAADSMVKATGIEDTPAEGMVDTLLDKASAETTPSATLKQARAALGQDRAVVDASGQAVNKTTKAARKQKVNDAVAAAHAPGKEPGKPKSEPKTEGAKRAAKLTHEAANTARTAEHTQLQGDAVEVARKLLDADHADNAAKGRPAKEAPDPIMSADEALAAFSMDLPAWLRTAYKGAEKMDGWFGKNNVKPFAISAEMSSQTMQHRYTAALRAVQKAHSPESIAAAVNVFRGMDGNAGLDVAVTDLAPEVADAARALWPVFSQVFDHSEHSLLQRIGMDGAYLNDYLRRQNVAEGYWMHGEQTWENGTAWTQWNWEGVNDPLALIDAYHRAIVRAQVVPDVAANFSSQFGNKSDLLGRPLSPEEAKAAGWVKADTQSGRFGGLFHFLDKEQYYPKEMLTQLAVMDKYFAASRTLDENTVFDKFFRYADPVVNSLKASITLWRPGHHVTNIMGEFLMNTLAGVYNPLRYSQALRVLGASGKVDGRAATALERYLQAAAPEGVTLKDVGSGVGVTIRGQKTRISDQQLYQLLDQSGAIIHHNQAEDLLNEGFDVVGRTGVNVKQYEPNKVQAALMKINRTVAPGWLGRFSANRDNVFRIAHAIDILEKKSFGSLSEAVTYLTKEINSYHPNMHTLGAAEQKYVRRLIYFYTWQRQALTRVMLSMIDTPGRITLAPKALYNASAANGADPQSWGEPVSDQGGIPDYLRGNIGQVMFKDGLIPGEDDADNYLWGASINAPQLDILQSVLGSAAVDPEKPMYQQAGETAWQLTSKNVLQNLSPVFKIPAELGSHAQLGTGIPIQEGEEGRYLINQTGLRAPAVVAGLLDDENDDPSVIEQKRKNALFNWGTGVRRTIYDGPEQYDIWKRQLQEKQRQQQ